MKNIIVSLGIVLVFSVIFVAAGTASDFERYWHQWRGPHMTGVSPSADPPLEWSETKNVKWKIAIPGKGHATPIIWKDRIFILSAVETEKESREQAQNSGPQRGRGRCVATPFLAFFEREGFR